MELYGRAKQTEQERIEREGNSRATRPRKTKIGNQKDIYKLTKSRKIMSQTPKVLKVANHRVVKVSMIGLDFSSTSSFAMSNRICLGSHRENKTYVKGFSCSLKDKQQTQSNMYIQIKRGNTLTGEGEEESRKDEKKNVLKNRIQGPNLIDTPASG